MDGHLLRGAPLCVSRVIGFSVRIGTRFVARVYFVIVAVDRIDVGLFKVSFSVFLFIDIFGRGAMAFPVAEAFTPTTSVVRSRGSFRFLPLAAIPLRFLIIVWICRRLVGVVPPSCSRVLLGPTICIGVVGSVVKVAIPVHHRSRVHWLWGVHRGSTWLDLSPIFAGLSLNVHYLTF